MIRAKKAARFLGKQIPSMFEKNVERSINNLYTGRGLSKKGKTVALLGMGTYAGYEMVSGYSEASNMNAEANMDTRGIMSLPGSQADGTGYITDNGGNADLGARGDIVFALHRLRHGG